MEALPRNQNGITVRLFLRGKKWTAIWWWQGKRFCRSTGSTNRRDASVIAQKFLDAQKTGRVDLLDAAKLRRTSPTISAICKIYLQHARCRQETARTNCYKLRQLLALVGLSEAASVSVLDASFNSRVSRAAKLRGWRDTSISTTIRQARSVFARSVLPAYSLPHPPGWIEAPMPRAARVSGFVPFPSREWRLICRDVILARKSGDDDLWRAFLLMARCGMGNDEVISARGSWLVQNGIRIQARSDWTPKSDNRVRTIPMRPIRFTRYFAHLTGSDKLIVPFGKQVIYRRLNPIIRRHFPSRQKAAYELRKHAGSVIATRYGIFEAAKFLGDNVQTVERYYAALLRPLRAI